MLTSFARVHESSQPVVWQFSKPAEKEAESNGIRRVLLFRWKPDASHEDIQQAHDLWTELSGKVDGFDHFTWMENTNTADLYFHHAAILDFESPSAVLRYEQHASHQRLVELGPEIIESFSETTYNIKP